jgi:hypothetical protein
MPDPALNTKAAVSQALSLVMCLSLLEAATSQAPTCLMPPTYTTTFLPHTQHCLYVQRRAAKKKKAKREEEIQLATRGFQRSVQGVLTSF